MGEVYVNKWEIEGLPRWAPKGKARTRGKGFGRIQSTSTSKETLHLKMCIPHGRLKALGMAYLKKLVLNMVLLFVLLLSINLATARVSLWKSKPHPKAR
ncbi:hypothetical protein CR513_15895, partial [Mucuna pruriens]